MVIKSISLSPEFEKKVNEYQISLSEAVRVGISVILAEKDAQMLNPVQVERRFKMLNDIILDLQTKLDEYQNVATKKK